MTSDDLAFFTFWLQTEGVRLIGPKARILAAAVDGSGPVTCGNEFVTGTGRRLVCKLPPHDPVVGGHHRYVPGDEHEGHRPP